MKTFLLRSLNLIILSGTTFCTTLNAQSSTSNELVFINPTLESGVAGADNCVYRFPLVNNDLDALVTITGRSSSQVTLTSIDLTNTGFSKAFQPQIDFNNGTVTGSQSWWLEFKISFVNKNSSIPAQVLNFYTTALDIDGNGNKLREWDAFYGANSYTLESVTQLSVSDITGSVFNLLAPGKKFTGTNTTHNGIDTSATSLMTTLNYASANSLTIRLGATTTGSVNGVDRMYSIWFKSFTYNLPLQSTLPLQLVDFTATLNKKKVDLSWTTVNELNVSHFVVEKSYDGINYSDAGLVFAFGNTSSRKTYSIPDVNIPEKGIIHYRLRSFDIDGKTQVSEVRIVRVGTPGSSVSIRTYPNPVVNDLRIELPKAWQNKQVIVELFSLSGQSLIRRAFSSASQTETLGLNDLEKGLYVLRVSCGSEVSSQKIIK